MRLKTLLLLVLTLWRNEGASPDLIIFNALIYHLDSTNRSEAIAIQGNKIEALGRNGEIKALANSKTRMIDGRQGALIPGFNDAHVHFLSGGFQLSSVDLRTANSPS